MYRLTAVFLDEEAANWAAHLLRKISDVLSVTVEEIGAADRHNCPMVHCRIIGPHDHTMDGAVRSTRKS